MMFKLSVNWQTKIKIRMSEAVYLEKVRVFLTQELPQPYNKLVTINDSATTAVIPESITFNYGYAKLYHLIETSIQRIRNREYDLNFTIWTPNQLRDFKIYK
jgi:hypothetical protein